MRVRVREVAGLGVTVSFLLTFLGYAFLFTPSLAGDELSSDDLQEGEASVGRTLKKSLIPRDESYWQPDKNLPAIGNVGLSQRRHPRGSPLLGNDALLPSNGGPLLRGGANELTDLIRNQQNQQQERAGERERQEGDNPNMDEEPAAKGKGKRKRKCSKKSCAGKRELVGGASGVVSLHEVKGIDCYINTGRDPIGCLANQDDVYIPFAFIEKYFEVYGYRDTKAFYMLHTDSEPYPLQGRYRADGAFLSFEKYNVDYRPRVMYICGKHGVPVTSQWDKQGHYYPIQIGQYCLSHYSKHVTLENLSGSSALILQEENSVSPHWRIQQGARLEPVYPPEERRGDRGSLHFLALENEHIYYNLESKIPSSHCLSFDIRFRSNVKSGLTLAFENQLNSSNRVFITYASTEQPMVTLSTNHFAYGLGVRTSWVGPVHRTLDIDLLKVKIPQAVVSNLHLVRIALFGEGWIRNMVATETCHLGKFYDAANWLVSHQDSRGGWGVNVARPFPFTHLEKGWYSAMGQGLGMGCLVRAYTQSKDPRYLEAANKAVRPFFVSSAAQGVRARFMEMFDWYEEYPTAPPMFVLNGFLYSLFGLYDLTTVSRVDAAANQLYKQGIRSLEAMLPLFDTGFGSLYDLRHVTFHVAPNRARWDYHYVHISQLFALSTISPTATGAAFFNSTATRWLSYTEGQRSPAQLPANGKRKGDKAGSMAGRAPAAYDTDQGS